MAEAVEVDLEVEAEEAGSLLTTTVEDFADNTTDFTKEVGFFVVERKFFSVQSL